VNRPDLHPRTWWALALVPLVLASCSSGSSPETPDAKLKGADDTVLTAVHDYQAKATSCKAASNPVVCLEAADRALGGQIHTYANLLAVGHGFTAPPTDLTTARNTAQTLANSLEILGDAQPTQANYDQVLNTFNVTSALGQLESAVTKVSGKLSG
jgi:hypothetical protein